MDSERTLTQKIVLWALLAMAVVFTAVNIILKLRPGVAFEDTLLSITQDGETISYIGEKYGDPIIIAVSPEGSGHKVELTIGSSIDHLYRVEYPGGTITGEYGQIYDRITITRGEKVLFDGGYNPEASWSGYCELDGESVFTTRIRYESGDPWYNYELHFSEVVDFAAGPETTTRGNWVYYAAALFCSIVCAVGVAFPRTLHELRYHRVVRDPEPTETALRMNEISGVVAALLILAVYIYGATRII